MPNKKALRSAAKCFDSFSFSKQERQHQKAAEFGCVIGVLIHEGLHEKMSSKDVNRFIKRAKSH